MISGIFITANDVQKLLGCERYATAHKYLTAVRDALGKKNAKYITIKEFCDYEELDFEYVWKIIRGHLDINTLNVKKPNF